MPSPAPKARAIRSACTPSAIALSIAAGLALCLLSPHADAQVLSEKRGFADVGAGYQNLQATGAGWYYTWGLGAANPGNFDARFAPMFWSTWAVNQGNIDAVKNNPNVEWVLGFNEPERSDQANLTVAQAVASWRTLSAGFAGTDKKLVTPAVSDTSEGKAWMSDFKNQITSEGLKVDAVAFHWYGWSTPNNVQQAAANFMGSVNWYHNLWNKPVFITEFAIHDWGGTYPVEDMKEANSQFLEIVIPQLEATSWVEGYAWYHWFSDAPLYEGNPLTPTPLGYDYVGVLGQGDIYDFSQLNHGEHVAYLGGGILNHGGGTTGTLRYINALTGRSALAGSPDWSLGQGGWVRVQPDAILRKTNYNRIDWSGAAVSNQGTLEVDDGKLVLGSSVTGSGQLTVGTYGNATTASVEFAGDALIANSIGFRGRTNTSPAFINASGLNTLAGPLTLEFGGSTFILRSDEGTLRLTGQAPQAGGVAITTIEDMGERTVTLDGEGQGLIRGSIENASGTTLGITKTGDGTWTLAGENSYAGATSIGEGTLLIEGTTGFGDTLLSRYATLGGAGTVRADLSTGAGSTLIVGEEGMPRASAGTHASIEDFETYPTGTIGASPNTTSDVWQTVFNGTQNAEIVDNGSDHALRIRGVRAAQGWRGAATNLAEGHAQDFTLGEGETGTYFFRVRRDGEGSIYALMGLSDLGISADPGPGTDVESPFDEYAVTLVLVGQAGSTTLRVYSEGEGYITLRPVDDGQWLNVWLTVDNAGKTFRVATSTGIDDGTDSGAAYSFGQRTAAQAGALTTFGFHESKDVPAELDALAFAQGTDLTNPLNATVPQGQTLTIGGDLHMGSDTTIRFDASSPEACDNLAIGGDLMARGAIALTLDPEAPTPALGDSFRLLSFTSATGGFTTLDLPALPSGLGWDASSLLVDGTISVVGSCTADLTSDGKLDVDDVLAFLGAFAASDPAADLVPPVGTLDIDDVLAFLTAFANGCP